MPGARKCRSPVTSVRAIPQKGALPEATGCSLLPNLCPLEGTVGRIRLAPTLSRWGGAGRRHESDARTQAMTPTSAQTLDRHVPHVPSKKIVVRFST